MASPMSHFGHFCEGPPQNVVRITKRRVERPWPVSLSCLIFGAFLDEEFDAILGIAKLFLFDVDVSCLHHSHCKSIEASLDNAINQCLLVSLLKAISRLCVFAYFCDSSFVLQCRKWHVANV
eukprot:3029206-Amphidinium_carterae.1